MLEIYFSQEIVSLPSCIFPIVLGIPFTITPESIHPQNKMRFYILSLLTQRKMSKFIPIFTKFDISYCIIKCLLMLGNPDQFHYPEVFYIIFRESFSVLHFFSIFFVFIAFGLCFRPLSIYKHKNKIVEQKIFHSQLFSRSLFSVPRSLFHTNYYLLLFIFFACEFSCHQHEGSGCLALPIKIIRIIYPKFNCILQSD